MGGLGDLLGSAIAPFTLGGRLLGGLLGGGGGGGGGDQFNAPYPGYLPQNMPTYQPTQSGGTFSDWLRALPTPQQLSPMNTSLQKTGVGPNMVPAMWLQFAPFAQGLINQGAAAQRQSAISGSANSRRDFERQLLGAYQGQGLNPLFAQRSLAESRPQAGYQLQSQLGQIESGRLGDTLSLQQGIQNALAQSYTNDRNLNIGAFTLEKSRGDAQKAANQALFANLFGAGAGALGSIFGGL